MHEFNIEHHPAVGLPEVEDSMRHAMVKIPDDAWRANALLQENLSPVVAASDCVNYPHCGAIFSQNAKFAILLAIYK